MASELNTTTISLTPGAHSNINWDLVGALSDTIDILGSVVIPVSGGVGILCNMFTVCVVCFMGVHTSSLVYMLLIALGDSLSVAIDAIVNIGFTHWNWVVVLARSSMFCRFGQWISYLTTFATQYTLVLFTFDRFLAIARPIPYKNSLKSKLWYPVAATGVTYVAVSLLLVGNLYVFTLENGSCLIDSTLSEGLQAFYFHYSVSFLYCGFPAAMLFVLNIAIIYKLKKPPSGSGGGGGSRSQERSITKGLLLVSCTYLLLTFLSSMSLFIIFTQTQPRISADDPKWEKWTVLLFYLAEWTGLMNQCVNFFLYILGSRFFRKEFFRMIKSTPKPNISQSRNTVAAAN